MTRLREERGFTIVPSMGMLVMGMLLVLGTYSAVGGDLPLASGDQDRKQAYAAAEAGIAYYLYHLDEDNTYWTKCTNVERPNPNEPSPVVDAWNGSGTDTREGHWRNVPGSAAQYAVELLPAPGYTRCVLNDQRSMINPTNGTMRIRSTGRVRGVKRSIVATFKRKSFLDYLYFTVFETLDPLAYSTTNSQTWATNNCVRYHSAGRSTSCQDIRFITGDYVTGPLHTNDSLYICGRPVFGRNAADPIEASGPPPGWWQSGCTGNPDFQGTWKPGAASLDPPATNSSLATVAAANYRYTGTTTIRLLDNRMQVTNANLTPQTQTVDFPANGVVWVRNGSCGTSYRRQQTYSDPAGCANVYLSGTYSKDLTIGSENDIIIRPPAGQTNGDVIRNGDVMLGLIPQNFVRIYHPVNFSQNGCPNAAGTMTNVRVDAAILALRHSFIVDNYYCGAKLGNLTVNGAIAQRFRGPVGTGASSGTGYLKDYDYDDRLRYRNPVHFLDPVQAAWTIRRQTEQVPAR